MTAPTLLTAYNLLHMPKDGYRHELPETRLVKMTPARRKHGRYVAHVGSSMRQHVAAHQLGEVSAAETGFILESDPDAVRAPDAASVTRDRIEQAEEVPDYWHFAPDLAVEVISPNDTYAEVEHNVFHWLDSGHKGSGRG